MVFVTVGLFQIPTLYTRLIATFLVILVIYLDSLDGYVARKLKVASDLGALFDITGDRIVENTFWIYFSFVGMVTFWVPVIVVARGFLVDSVRTIAFKKGETPFGEKTMMKSRFTKFLVASRFSRAVYGGSKLVIFTLSGFTLFLKTGVTQFNWATYVLGISQTVITIFIYIAVFLCIIRGLPVLWDGKDVLFERAFPHEMRIG